MGGKRTLSSMRKQSAPHIFAILFEAAMSGGVEGIGASVGSGAEVEL
jgi:hypothetical protein